MTLNSSYQYIGRSNGVKAYDRNYYYYILLYAKTSGSQDTGKHTVSIKMRLACEQNATFYLYPTTASAKVDGASAISWTNQQIPSTAWGSGSITEGGVTYARYTDLKEGSVEIDTQYLQKDITITASWQRLSISGTPPHYLPSTTAATASITVTLPMIPGASAINYVSNVTLGGQCCVKWTPKSAAFYYKMDFQLGNWKHSTEVVHPNRTSEYTYAELTIPLEVANQIPDDPSGKMYVYLHTFADSAGTVQIGNTASETFRVTVPDNTATKPDVDMKLTPVHSLPEKFSGLYIQGRSKVKGTLSADGQYGASINTITMKVGTKSYGEDAEYTSDYLNTPDTLKVTGSAKDSRGFTGTNEQQIQVVAYQAPKLESASAVRCDANGNESESGTYIKIYAKRSYTPVDGLNICQVQYCYSKVGEDYSQWDTLLESTQDTDEVMTDALLGNLSAQASYEVHIRAIDEIGKPADSFITIPTEKVYWHRDGARNALGLGKYNEQEDAIDSAWDFHMNGRRVTGLPAPEDDTDAVPFGFLRDYVPRTNVYTGFAQFGGADAGGCSYLAAYILTEIRRGIFRLEMSGRLDLSDTSLTYEYGLSIAALLEMINANTGRSFTELALQGNGLVHMWKPGGIIATGGEGYSYGLEKRLRDDETSPRYLCFGRYYTSQGDFGQWDMDYLASYLEEDAAHVNITMLLTCSETEE